MGGGYRKRVHVKLEGLEEAIATLKQWRGYKTGRGFKTITIYFHGSSRHMRENIECDQVLIICQT